MLITRLLGRQRLTLGALLVGLPIACWAWVIAMGRDMYGPMTGASAWMMRATWDAPYTLLVWAMWAAMMAGMMLPSAAPLILLVARADQARTAGASGAHRTTGLVAGYLLAWTIFSAGTTLAQRLLMQHSVLTPMLEPQTSAVSAAVLLLAGAYQFTPLKGACLRACRTPITWLAAGWHHGALGAVRTGLSHGVSCLGCCWALMLLLFAGGVMNLWVVAALTAWVAVEKLAPFGERSARVSGALLLLGAAWLYLA